MSESGAKYTSFRLLCLQNAKDNLKAAKALSNLEVNHLVVHLSLLAVEEIGKIFMSFILLNQKEDWDDQALKVPLDDHVKKIFYAIWGPSLGREITDKDQWNDNKVQAKKLHDLRLSSLYGDLNDEVSSAKKIDSDTAQAILAFAKSRLVLAEAEGEIDLNAPIDEDLVWFHKMAAEKRNDGFLFGETAQLKLIELNDVHAWMKWLRCKKGEEEAMLANLAFDEINREISTDASNITSKWELTFIVISQSHSIKPSELSTYNKLERLPLQLLMGKDKHTLIIKKTLGSNVSVKELFSLGFHICRMYVASLNIATNGFIYWNIPTNHTKYYEKILDLQSSQSLEVRLNDERINWREKNQYLTTDKLVLAEIVYRFIGTVTSKKNAKSVTDYIMGLSLLAKSDLHLDLKLLAFGHFYSSFKTAVLANQPGANEENFSNVGYSQIETLINDSRNFERIIEIGKQAEKGAVSYLELTSIDLFFIKEICECYILTLACRHQTNTPDLCLTSTV